VFHSPFDVLSSIDPDKTQVFVGWCDGDRWVSFYRIEDGVLDCCQVGDWQLIDKGGADGFAESKMG
jgi:hypothetical protein